MRTNVGQGGVLDPQQRVARILRRGRGPENSPAEEGQASPPLDSLVPGYWVEEGTERVYVGEARFPLGHTHGVRALDELRAAAGAPWPGVLFADRRPFDLSRALFLDTETTGLGRGPSTLCFMVGTGVVENGYLVVRQYMVPDYGHEPLMLRLIEQQAAQASGLVSFNGRTFDLPLLETRFVMNGYAHSPLKGLAHLDLLPTARRLWGRSQRSCALGALEENLLGILRSDQDIPGYLIPGIYAEFLSTGATEELARVFYHNRYDILSMVTLATEAGDVFANPYGASATVRRDPVALGRIREADDAPDQAQDAYRSGLSARDARTRDEARRRLAMMLKRAGDLQQAAALWLEALDDGTLSPYVELAKYYEHRPLRIHRRSWS